MEIEDRAKRSDLNLTRQKEKQVQRRYVKVRNHGLVVIGVCKYSCSTYCSLSTLVPICSTTVNQRINFCPGLSILAPTVAMILVRRRNGVTQRVYLTISRRNAHRSVERTLKSCIPSNRLQDVTILDC